MSELLEAARNYLRCGWMPVYVPSGVKGPNRPGWEKLRLTEADLTRHFNRAGNIGIVLGEASGGLVDVDLDCPEALEVADQYLPATSAVTGRPGAPRSHRWYVADVQATKQFRDPKTRKMIVELRSNGGQTLVGPSRHAETSEPYDFLDGEPSHVPADVLMAAVEAIYDAVMRRRYGEVPQKRTAPAPAAVRRETEPDVLERRALAYLQAMPPAVSGSGGHAATYTAATALVHGFGLPPGRALQILLTDYNPRCQPPWTEKELQHKVQDAANKPHDRPFGWLRDQDQTVVADDVVDLSGILAGVSAKREKQASLSADDPGPIPETMLRIPGFISEVMDYTMATAPYPQLELAFAGALSLQALLAGRKVKDALSNRTTLYVVALANSGAGKDHPRKVNQRVLVAAGLADCIGDTFASGEGIEDRLHVTNSVLFQTDEVDALMAAIRDGKESRYETVLSVLLKFYSSCNGVYSLRVKAGKDYRYIDQPNLCIFGTAIPQHYYQSLSSRMLTNGFFARVIVIEAGKRGAGQEPPALDVPERLLVTAKWWAQFRPGNEAGNLDAWHPDPKNVELSGDAAAVMREAREEADAEYAKSEESKDVAAMAIWARAYEKARRLSLIHACSENRLEPMISRRAAEWAWAFARHQTQRMLFMAQNYVAENPFHALCLKAMEKLRSEPDGTLPHSRLLKRMKVDAQTFQKVIDTLRQQDDIDVVLNPTPGRTGTCYRLLQGVKEAGERRPEHTGEGVKDGE